MSYKRLALLAAALLLAGVVAASLPGLYADWRFLRAVRIYNEQQAARPAAPAAKGP